jgi:hypothetical protein
MTQKSGTQEFKIAIRQEKMGSDIRIKNGRCFCEKAPPVELTTLIKSG